MGKGEEGLLIEMGGKNMYLDISTPAVLFTTICLLL